MVLLHKINKAIKIRMIKPLWLPVKKPRFFLLAYQEEFGGIKNDLYFKGLMLKYPEYELVISPISHLVDNYYLFGRLRIIKK
ncbi:MAG: hypothetical protein COV01_03575 [Candidatus Taylorbacteria bacterium CG10_big_fil_rev_8_21_14_0_10_41_48]|uniref:Uncharacterized protein n=1 Tax=Candidatus Taylorbacteria bacterium CG10_big_fil_rev_8_21_14_0_10_41_48 TaxID=1975024 RepID=A0A2M8LBD0_9BACT|nr:MAG: hypothetical protein COV01_03575 [Candidatus Taylorbacteria bacterium CG10_big_fil_rev_8_21_14_0_10_41_48]